MEIALIIISSLALIVALIALVIIIKVSKRGSASIGDTDIEKIRKSVVNSVNDLSKSISELIASKNEEVIKDVFKKDYHCCRFIGFDAERITGQCSDL